MVRLWATVARSLSRSLGGLHGSCCRDALVGFWRTGGDCRLGFVLLERVLQARALLRRNFGPQMGSRHHWGLSSASGRQRRRKVGSLNEQQPNCLTSHSSPVRARRLRHEGVLPFGPLGSSNVCVDSDECRRGKMAEKTDERWMSRVADNVASCMGKVHSESSNSSHAT